MRRDARPTGAGATKLRRGAAARIARTAARGRAILFDPYAGVGMSFEVLSLDLGPRTTTYRGFEWLSLQAGADWPFSNALRVGPVVSYGLGQFLWRNGSSIDSTDLHHWIHFAVRATYDL